MKHLGGIDVEDLNRIIAKKQFRLKSQMSLSWLDIALGLFRSSQLLFEHSSAAHKIQIDMALEELTHRKKEEGSSSRQLTQEEAILMMDGRLIRFSYFLLARALEILLKAILIERQEDYFLKINDDGKQIFDARKLGHNLASLVKECQISLDESEIEKVELLQPLLYWGTFPVPLNEEILIEYENLKSNAEISLSIGNFRDVSLLFDKFLAILNSDRLKNDKLAYRNILRP